MYRRRFIQSLPAIAVFPLPDSRVPAHVENGFAYSPINILDEIVILGRNAANEAAIDKYRGSPEVVGGLALESTRRGWIRFLVY